MSNRIQIICLFVLVLFCTSCRRLLGGSGSRDRLKENAVLAQSALKIYKEKNAALAESREEINSVLGDWQPIDNWGQKCIVRFKFGVTYGILSSGPDCKFGTPDDMEV
jgi:hypothetical protein